MNATERTPSAEALALAKSLLAYWDDTRDSSDAINARVAGILQTFSDAAVRRGIEAAVDTLKDLYRSDRWTLGDAVGAILALAPPQEEMKPVTEEGLRASRAEVDALMDDVFGPRPSPPQEGTAATEPEEKG